MKKGLMIGGSLGSCVHVAGVIHFLAMAEEEGYETLFLGPANSIDHVLEAVAAKDPDYVDLGYRLTPANVVPLIEELIEKSRALLRQPIWIFGGTRPVAEEVRKFGFFDVIFDGTEDLDDCIAYLRTGTRADERHADAQAQTLRGRCEQKRPYPLLRHHFGLPSYEDTVAGVEKIARARVLDVLSLGIDQNTQQFYFHPDQRDTGADGAGGVPVHTEQEFVRLKQATQCGNNPLMRCYSGTADVLALANVLHRTLDNAWCAVPLSWYNELDGRGTRTLETSMREAQALIAWHGERNIPVEVNEPHHWGLRDAHDVISVVMSFLSAYHAKKYGARDYISQYMFNIPNSMSFSMDLAKVLAQNDLVQSLAAPRFQIYKEVRAGLPFLSADLDVAKGQLAASTMLAMNLAPDIIHVVGYSEAEQAATPEIVIESCKIVRGVVRSTLHGAADATADPRVQARRQELRSEARVLLEFIQAEYPDSPDPFADAAVLSDCIRRGILDAPHIVRPEHARGSLSTRMHNGACLAYDTAAQRFLTEAERLDLILEKEASHAENCSDQLGKRWAVAGCVSG